MDYSAREYEREIDLKVVIAGILKKWRKLLVFMIVGALILGGYKGYSIATADNSQALKEAEKQVAICQENLDKKKDAIEAGYETIDELEASSLAIEGALARADSENASLVEIGDLSRILSDNRNSISRAQDDIETYEEELEPLEEELESAKDTVAALEGKSYGGVIKFGILGLMLGVFVLCAWEFCRIAFATKLCCSNDLKGIYSLILLGQVHTKDSNPVKGIDKLAEKIDPDYQNTNNDEACSVILSKAKAISREPESKLAITGTLDYTKLQELKGLLDKNNSIGMDIVVLPNPVYNADAVNEMQGRDIVIAEEIEGSRTDEMEKLAELLFACKAEVIGSIAVR